MILSSRIALLSCVFIILCRLNSNNCAFADSTVGDKKLSDEGSEKTDESNKSPWSVVKKFKSHLKKTERILTDMILSSASMFTRRDKGNDADDSSATQTKTIAQLPPSDPNLDSMFEAALKLLGSNKKSEQLDGYKILEEASNSGHRLSKLKLAWEVLLGNVNGDSQHSKYVFEELASIGEPDAHMGLGFLNAVGLTGLTSDQARALVHYMVGAFGGSVWSQIVLGYRYKDGVSVVADCEKSLEFYSLAAKEVVNGMTLSGGAAVHRIRLMDLEDGKSGNYWLEADAIQYFEHEAERGNVNIQITIGQMYYHGLRGCPRDVKKAEYYFNMAMKRGHPTAMGYLGRIHLENSDSPRTGNSSAFHYFKKAASHNSPIGLSGLGLMYLEGQGVEVDLKKARRYFARAADLGWVEGQLQLGLMYLKGLGVGQNYRLAINYFHLAAQNGHIVAYYHLAEMHSHGLGVIRSCATAVELYKSVAERGKWNEYMVLGHQKYISGRYFHAFIVYALLAELGYEVAQTNAAYLLEKDLSGLENITKEEKYARAYNYWRRAAVQGYSSAFVKMGDYHYYGLGVPVDFEAAAHHYRLASAESNPQALFNIGYMHEQGIGIPKDLQLAKRFYDLAATVNTEAYIPVLMALVKLAAIMALNSLVSYLPSSFAEVFKKFRQLPWDIHALVTLSSMFFFLIWRRML